MKNLIKNPFFYFTIILTFLFLWQIADFVFAQWISPQEPPPSLRGIGLPLTTGDNLQIKTGPLELGGLTVNSTTIISSSIPILKFKQSDVSYANLYFTGGGFQIGISGNNEIFYLSSGGNLGLGTTTPQYKLDVVGALRLQPTSQPSAGANGVIYYDSNENKFKCYQNGAWVDCISPGTILCSGNPNYLVKWQSSNTLTSSIIQEIGNEITISGNLVVGNIITSTQICLTRDRCIDTWPITSGGDTYWTLSGSNLYVSSTAWNVGIGTTNPQYKLDVVGNAKIRGNLYVDNNVEVLGNPGRLTLSLLTGSSPSSGTILGQLAFRSNYYNTTTAYINAIAESSWSGGDYPTALTFFTTNDNYYSPTEKMRITGDGKVGIGTTMPLSQVGVVDLKLDVSGSGNNIGMVIGPTTDNISALVLRGGTSGSYWLVGRGGSSLGDRFSILFTPNGTTWKETFVISTTTNVGIGTSTPSYKLHLFESSRSLYSGLGINTQNHGHPSISLLVDGIERANIFYDRNSSTLNIFESSQGLSIRGGNVGIGTTEPGEKLEIAGTQVGIGIRSDTSGDPFIRWKNGSTIMGDQFWSRSQNRFVIRGASGVPVQISAAGQSESASNPHLFIATTGNVGIGTKSPGYKLDVPQTSGNIARFGNLAINDGWATGVTFDGRTYDYKQAIFASGTGGACKMVYNSATNRAGWVCDGPIMSTEDGAYFAGNVGIGTTDPIGKLHVNGPVRFIQVMDATSSYAAVCIDHYIGLLYEKENNIGRIYVVGWGPEGIFGKSCDGDPGFGRENRGKVLLYKWNWDYVLKGAKANFSIIEVPDYCASPLTIDINSDSGLFSRSACDTAEDEHTWQVRLKVDWENNEPFFDPSWIKLD